ncbi:hypothetical protein PHYSODRAFT_523128, partial [Phytophthora sojae]
WNRFSICLLPLCLPGFFDSAMAAVLWHQSVGVLYFHLSSSQSPLSHITSRAPSFIAIYSVSIVL